MYRNLYKLGVLKRMPFRSRLELSTRSVMAALKTPIASRIVDLPEPFAPMKTFTFPGSNVTLFNALKPFTEKLSIFIKAPQFLFNTTTIPYMIN